MRSETFMQEARRQAVLVAETDHHQPDDQEFVEAVAVSWGAE